MNDVLGHDYALAGPGIAWANGMTSLVHIHMQVKVVNGGIRGTVAARWTSGQQVERSILRQEHDS